MFRAALFGLTAAVGLTLPAASSAADRHVYPEHRHHHPPVHACWTVLARGCDREPWRDYGNFRDEHLARSRARELRHHGFEAIVVRG
jgi:hypothetical protein